MEEIHANHGLIFENLPHDVNVLGGVMPDIPLLVADSNWKPYRPEFEAQNRNGVECMGCVQYSRLNVCEYYANWYKIHRNYSDRDLCISSGCGPEGNTFRACDYALKNYGVCLEETLPWPQGIKSQSEYLLPPANYPDIKIKEERQQFIDNWDQSPLILVTLDIDHLKVALQHGPIWVCNENHAFVLESITDTLNFFDTYPHSETYGEWHMPLEYLNSLQAAYLAPIMPKDNLPPLMFTPEEGFQYFVADHGGQFLYCFNNKLYRDTAGNIDMFKMWFQRMKDCDFTKYRSSILINQLKGQTIYNSKGEPLETL